MENDDVAALPFERLRSALRDPEKLDQLKKVVSILKEKIIDVEKFAQQPRSDKTGSSKWTSKKNNMASERKRKHFVEKTPKHAK